MRRPAGHLVTVHKYRRYILIREKQVRLSSRGHQDSDRCIQVFLQLQEVECRRPSHKLPPSHGGGSGTLRAWLSSSMALPVHLHLLAPSPPPAGQTAPPPWYLSETVHNCCNSVIVIIFQCVCVSRSAISVLNGSCHSSRDADGLLIWITSC